MALPVWAAFGAAAERKPVASKKPKPAKAVKCRKVTTPKPNTRKPAKRPTKKSASGKSLDIRKKPAKKPKKPKQVCLTGSPAAKTVKSTAMPTYVPSRLSAEVGGGERNGGKHDWATLGSTLAAASSFTGPTGSATIRLLGAPAAKRIDFENGAMYRTSAYTALQAFHGSSLKESIVVPKRLGTTTWIWQLDAPGARRPKLTPSGAIDLRNGLFIPPPVVTDANGKRLTAPGSWTLGADSTLALTITDTKYAVPYVVDPGVTPTAAFTGFTATSGNTYVDPTFALSRIFINSSQSGAFTVNAVVNDPDDVTQQQVCFPVYGSGWTSDGGCVAGTSGSSLPGTLATYFSGSTSGSPATYPGAAMTSTNYGADTTTPSASDCTATGGTVGPFSRIESTIDSFANWGTAGVDDAPYPELCEDRFSAKWEGTVRTTATGGTYYFSAFSDDGVRITVNNTLIMQDWNDHTVQWNASCPIALAANTAYPITVEYYENGAATAPNRMQLRWKDAGNGVTPPIASGSCHTSPGRMFWATTVGGSTRWVPIGTNITTPSASWPILPVAPTGASPGLRMPTNSFTRSYAWSAGAAVPTPQTQDIRFEDEAAVDPTPGLAPFTVIADSTGPTGGTMTVSTPAGGGSYGGPSANVRLAWNAHGTTDGTPGAASGIAGTGSVWRQSVPLDNGDGTCDAWPATWTSGNSTSVSTGIATTASNASDSTIGTALVSGFCYRWALVFQDNVGNVGAVASPELRYDTSGPTSSGIVLTPLTNTNLMHVSGSTLFYNNSSGNVGTFRVDVAATDLGSGMQRVDYPSPGATWSPATLQSDVSSPYEQTMGWTATSAAVGSYTATLYDTATNSAASSAVTFTPDSTPPASGSVTYLDGFFSGTTYSVGFNAGNDGTGAGVATWHLERQSSIMQPSGTCDPFTASWAQVGPTDPVGAAYLDTLTPAMCYQWRVISTDRVGNTQTFSSTNVLRYDNTPPTASLLGLSSVAGNAALAGSTVWFNPAAGGSVHVDVTATDNVAMDRVTFPATGVAGWTGPSPAAITTPVGSTWTSSTYTWAPSAASSAVIAAVARDTSGNTTNVTFAMSADSSFPTGGFAEPPAALQASTSVPLTLTAPADAQSGLASWSISVQQATLSNNACTGWGSWASTGLSGTGTPPASTSHTVGGTGCYRYRIEATDAVANSGSNATSTNIVQVDVTNPTVAVTSPADLSYHAGTFTLSGTGAEAATILTSVVVTHTAPTAGPVCPTTTLTPSGAGTWTWSCSWDTLTVVDGSYTLLVTGTDSAGNTGTSTWHIRVDNTPPVASWSSWTENSANLHSPGGVDADLLWYNPAAPLSGSDTATATVSATDAGSGMDHVVFPGLGAAGWGGGGTTVTSVGPLWSHGYTFTGGGAIGNPALTNAVAYDIAGASTGAPALNFRIEPDSTAPSGGTFTSTPGLQATTTFTASATVGTDAHSGVGSWRLDYRFAPLVDGSCGTWDAWADGSTATGFSGTSSNGSSVGFSIDIDDANLDGIPDYVESLCFQTQLFVLDNVGNEFAGAVSGVHTFDFGNPNTTVSTPASGSGTVAVSGVATDAVADVSPAYPLTGSGLATVNVTYELPDGPDGDLLPDATGTICTTSTFTGVWTANGWTCPWVTNALPDGTYTVRAQATDAAGRTSTIATTTILLDNQAPVAAWHSWDDHGSAALHAAGTVAWINPAAPPGGYQLDARLTATDAGSGVSAVAFPAFGAGWTPGGAGNATSTSPVPVLDAYTRAFTFATPSALAAPGALVATVSDGATNSTTVGFDVRLDGLAPTGGAATVAAGLQNSATVNVAMTASSDNLGGSGMAGWQLFAQQTTLANDVCGAFVAAPVFVTGGTGSAPASYAHDVTALGSGCFRYTLVENDNVDNIATSANSAVRRVDIVTPTVAIAAPLAGTAHNGTFPVSGTADDAHSGIDHVAVTWTGPSSTSGTICNPATLGGASPNWTYSCSWVTGALPDGAYTILSTSFDRATNTSTTSSVSITLDNQPPYLAFHSFTESSPYVYWAGPVGANPNVYFNPNAPSGTYSFDVNVTTYDPSGIDRADFEGAGTGWTPGGSVASDTSVSATPAADSYSTTYTFDTANGGLVDPAALDVVSYDTALNPSTTTFDVIADTAAPSGGSVGAPNGYVPSTTVAVAIATGTDGGSGVASYALYRSDGTLTAGSCGSWGAYTAIPAASGSGTYTGTYSDTVVDPGCFRYELRVTDNVGNVDTITGADVVRVDLAPPSGSLTLSVGTNAAAQYLANPTRLFVNTNQTGTFTTDVTATATSGIQDVVLPSLATGFTPAGATLPGPGPSFSQITTFAIGASAPGTGLAATVNSNSLGLLSLPFEVIADPTAPTGASATYTGGFTTSTSSTITFGGGTDGTGSGVATWQLEAETGTLAAGACTWSGSWTQVGTIDGASFTDTGFAQASCHRYRVRSTDRVGNVDVTAAGAAIMVDTTAPTGASVVLTAGTTPSAQYVASSDTIWIDPTTAGSFTATVSATDAESGTGAATFPTLGSNWTTTPGVLSATFAWTGTAANPGSPVISVANGSGLTANVPFTVLLDAAAPSGATLDQQNGIDADFSLDLSYATGSDGAGSGIATWRIERRSAPYASGSCGAYGAWTTYPMPTGQPISPHVDSTVTQPNCYQYRLYEIDRVGHITATTDGDTGIVVNDLTPPDPFALTLPAAPSLPAITTLGVAPSCDSVPTYTTSTPLVDWTDSADAQSGLNRYDIYIDGVGSVTATTGPATSQWTAGSLGDGAHSIGVRAVDALDNFTDATPSFPTTVRIDTAAPTVNATSPSAASWTTDTTPTIAWTGSDSNCLARFAVYVDDLVTPIAITSGSEFSWTPSTALAEGSHQYRVEALDSGGHTTSSATISFSIDTTQPDAFTLVTPTNGGTVRGTAAVSWTASADTGSGLNPSTAYEIWVDGSLNSAVGPGLTTANVTGLTVGAHTVEVHAVDAVGNTRVTANHAFTSYGTIPSPTLVSPANNAEMNTVPALTWTWPSDGGPAPTDFDVRVDGVVVANVTYPTVTFAIADPGDGAHTWQIEQHDPYTGTVSSTTWTFVLDRTAPINLGPLTNLATVVSWPSIVDPAAPVASGVDYLEFWIDDGLGAVLDATLPAGATSHDYGTRPDGNYTMFVRAFDDAGNSVDSPALPITNDSAPPYAFALNAPAALPGLPAITSGPAGPACESAATYVTATPTLSWSASGDATSGLQGYDVVVDGVVLASVGPGVTSWVATPAITSGPHTWHVVARDVFGLTTASTPAPMNVRIDAAAPTATLNTPAASSFTADTTPTLDWSVGDDNCAARVELTIDGVVVDMFAASATNYTPPAPLTEGPHTWSVRAIDSAGNSTASVTRTVTVDTTAPTGVTAIGPVDGGSLGEGMLTFSWSAGSDAGSGLSTYDLYIDGALIATNLGTTSSGTYAIYAGAHTWTIRARDAVGNFADFGFTFTAVVVPDVTAPSTFDLLTPTNGAAVTSPFTFTWQPSTDFNGIASYRVLIDGSIAASTAGNVTSFTPTVGVGLPICSIDFDPSSTCGSIAQGSPFSYNDDIGDTDPDPAVSGPTVPWSTGAFAGWGTSGSSYGIGNPTTSVGWARDGGSTAIEYETAVPAGGASVRFSHRWSIAELGGDAFAGGTIEVRVDDENNGFGDDIWESTCNEGSMGMTNLECVHDIVATAGGYTHVMGGPAANTPLAYQAVFSGTSGTVQPSSLDMSDFAGHDVRFRFKFARHQAATDLGLASDIWRIDDVTLANPSLLPGAHTWTIEALDPSGNVRPANQTWSFNLS